MLQTASTFNCSNLVFELVIMEIKQHLEKRMWRDKHKGFISLSLTCLSIGLVLNPT